MKVPYLAGAGMLLAMLVCAALTNADQSGKSNDVIYKVADRFTGGNGVEDPGLIEAYDSGTTYCVPHWSVTSGSLILHRSTARSRTLLTDSGTSVSDVSNLELDSEGGPRVSLIYQDDCGYGIELNYFGINDWSSSTGTITSGVMAGDLVTPFAGTTFLTASSLYRSEIDSTEVNLRKPISCRTTLLYGFRWVELQEDFTMEATTLSTDSGYSSIRTNNHLYGFQIGAESTLWDGCRLRVDGTVKAGIYGNNGGHTTLTTGEFGALATGDRENHTAFLGELAVTGSYGLSECLWIYGGYQLLWIEGVALAPNQLSLAGSSFAGVDLGGNPFYHGATVGFGYSR